MFERFYVTSRGKTLEARTHAGEEITFTRMQIGSGSLPEGQSIEALTALITPIKYLPVSSAKSTGSTAIIQGQVTNNGIASSFAFREIGLFATDPIDGEILYAYANAGNNADLIPAYSTTPVEFTFSFNVSFTNTSNVTVVIDSSLAFYTKAEMDAALAEKLDAGTVYNDLDQTEEGFVLDARQGRKLAESIEEITATPLVLSIPSGQWSGTGSDRYITVTASNVTANSILVPHCDNTSAALLKGPLWCVPAAGSFTLHTSAVPAGTVNVLIQFVGTLGEANYQVLADVYSKAQTDEKIQQSTASVPFSLTLASGVTEQFVMAYTVGRLAVINFSVNATVTTSGSWATLFTIPSGKRPPSTMYPLVHLNGTPIQGHLDQWGTFGVNRSISDNQIVRGTIVYAIA